MAITFQDLVLKYSIQNVQGYGVCVVVPGTEFDPDWEDPLCSEGYRLVNTDFEGKAVTIVQKMKKEDSNGKAKRPVYIPAASVPKGKEIPAPSSAIVEEHKWTENEDQQLIAFWNQKVSVPQMLAKFPGRNEAFLRKRIRLLQKQCKIQSKWKKNQNQPEHLTLTRPQAIEHTRWTDIENQVLIELWNQKTPVSQMVGKFPGRSEHAIKLRLARLKENGLIKPRKKQQKAVETSTSTLPQKVEKTVQTARLKMPLPIDFKLSGDKEVCVSDGLFTFSVPKQFDCVKICSIDTDGFILIELSKQEDGK